MSEFYAIAKTDDSRVPSCSNSKMPITPLAGAVVSRGDEMGEGRERRRQLAPCVHQEIKCIHWRGHENNWL